MIFVDTGAWYAASVPDDADHAAATDFLANNTDRLTTTDYVLDELVTLLRARGSLSEHSNSGLLYGNSCDLIWVQATDVQSAWETFQRFSDKDWSFTDCVSRAVMARLGIAKAFSFDQHFRQFGTVEVLP